MLAIAPTFLSLALTTVSPAPPAALVVKPPTPAEEEGGKGDAKKDDEPAHKRFPHRGFLLEATGGVAGCTRHMCKDDLDAAPGGRFGVEVGWNFLGFVELGAQFDYSIMKLRGSGNPLQLHGIDPDGFARAASRGGSFGSDLAALSVDEGQGRMMNAGLVLRVHVIPRGRWMAFIGTGIGYNQWESVFDAPEGRVKVRLPGVSVPVGAGFGYHVFRFMAVNLQFHYTFAGSLGARVDAPGYDKEFVIEPTMEDEGAIDGNWEKSLPDLWTVVLGLRFRL